MYRRKFVETIRDLESYTFPSLLRNSLKKFPDNDALSFIGEKALTYREMGKKVESVARFLSGLGLRAGSKTAVWGANMPHWGIAYLAIVNYGGIAVPLMPDFSKTEVETVLSHCGVDALFVTDALYERIRECGSALPPIVIRLEDFTLIRGPYASLTPGDFSDTELPDIQVLEDDTASIIYTSGTTGRSKGVELSHKNLVWTAVQGQTLHRINKMDRCLSILPLSHVYEFTVDFTMQILNGAAVYYLGRPPAVSALLAAFQKVQPTIVCTVPIIMEKIYKNQVLPAFTKNAVVRFLYRIRPVQIAMHRLAGRKLKRLFGGYIKFFGIGGAKADPVVERFMKDAKFPYAIGYGLTETSPLLAGSGPSITRPGTIGIILEGVELEILNPDETGTGEIIARGPNVMKGYYRDPELTAAAFTTAEDPCGPGWFRTGDLGILEYSRSSLRLTLMGRSKNVILGSTGENIYPEDIESVLNRHPLVSESLVVQDDTGLVALVRLDEEKVAAEQALRTTKSRLEAVRSGEFSLGKAVNEAARDAKAAAEAAAGQIRRDAAYTREALISEIQFFVNSRVNRSSHIERMKLVDGFEKTASQKIKRYLYDLRTATVHSK